MPQDDRQMIMDNLRVINEQILKITHITSGHAMALKILGVQLVLFLQQQEVLLSLGLWRLSKNEASKLV